MKVDPKIYYGGGFTNLESVNTGHRPTDDMNLMLFLHDVPPVNPVTPVIEIDPDEIEPDEIEPDVPEPTPTPKKKNKLLILAAAIIGIYNIIG